jgi:hypothetical protein
MMNAVSFNCGLSRSAAALLYSTDLGSFRQTSVRLDEPRLVYNSLNRIGSKDVGQFCDSDGQRGVILNDKSNF